MPLKLRFVSNAASTLFLLVLPFRLWKLRRETIKVLPGHRGYAKLVCLTPSRSVPRGAMLVSIVIEIMIAKHYAYSLCQIRALGIAVTELLGYRHLLPYWQSSNWSC